jgi:hypothetical protein
MASGRVVLSCVEYYVWPYSVFVIDLVVINCFFVDMESF